MIIIGAGAIGIEFAYFYNQLGTRVTILEMLDTILPVEDREITAILAKSFSKNNIEIHTLARVENLKSTRAGVEVAFSKEGKQETVKAALALLAIGIRGNTHFLCSGNVDFLPFPPYLAPIRWNCQCAFHILLNAMVGYC